MVALGTGIAPMRAFIEERAVAKKDGEECGDGEEDADACCDVGGEADTDGEEAQVPSVRAGAVANATGNAKAKSKAETKRETKAPIKAKATGEPTTTDAPRAKVRGTSDANF